MWHYAPASEIRDIEYQFLIDSTIDDGVDDDVVAMILEDREIDND